MAVVVLDGKPAWSSSNTLHYIIAILPPPPSPLLATRRNSSRKICVAQKWEITSQRTRAPINMNFLNILVSHPRNGKMRSCAISSAVLHWKMHSKSFYFYFRNWQHNHIEQQRSAAQQWPIDFLHRRLAEQPCYFERLRSIFNLLDCMRRRHRPWMTNDRWHSMPLRPHISF